jgi:hypothetical protein
MTDASIPTGMIPDGHLVVDEDDVERFDIEIVATGDGRGAAVYGISPPSYAPAVYPKGESTYRVTRTGCPSVDVDLQRGTCDDPHCPDDDWCIHLRAAQLYHTRGLDDD